ncbi:MAG TPA: hypothetical protein VIV12_27220, partial [Streptosporangiaceae bacterium]
TLRAFNVWTGNPDEAATLFTRHADLHLREEARLREIAQSIRDRYAEQELNDPRQPSFGSWVTVQRGIAYHGDRARWCKRVADRLAEHRAVKGESAATGTQADTTAAERNNESQ